MMFQPQTNRLLPHSPPLRHQEHPCPSRKEARLGTDGRDSVVKSDTCSQGTQKEHQRSSAHCENTESTQAVWCVVWWRELGRESAESRRVFVRLCRVFFAELPRLKLHFRCESAQQQSYHLGVGPNRNFCSRCGYL